MPKNKDNLLDFSAERERLISQIEKSSNLDNIEVTKSIHLSRLKAEEMEPLLRRMNHNYAFVHSIGGRPMVKALIYNEHFNKEIIEFISPESVVIRHSNETAEGFAANGKEKGMTLGKWWLGHVHRKDYETVTFEPDKPSGEYSMNNGKAYYNTWEGFSLEPKKGNWKLTLKHIYKIFCNGDSIKFKYVIRWFAWAIQNPGQRAEVAVIFKGKKGAGKGFLLNTFVKIFGRHGLVISNRAHLTGQFNEHLAMCSFLFADEAYHPGDKEVEGILKNIITEPSLTTEPKFRGLKIGNNCLHIAMSTNAEWVIPATEDERRYFINEVSNTYAMNQISNEVREKYFDRLYKEMNKDGMAAMLYDLLNMKLEDWHPRKSVPETEELKRQIQMSLPKLKYGISTLLEDGIFPGEVNKDGKYIITAKNLLEYLHSLDNTNKSITSKSISNLIKDLGIKSIRTSYNRFYIFPELGELRRIWNIRVAKTEWNVDEKWVVQTQKF